MQNTKIEWTDASWNPVTGCMNTCEYCYACGIIKRFAGCEPSTGYEIKTDNWLLYDYDIQPQRKTKSGKMVKAVYPHGFALTFHRYWLDKPQTWKNPLTVFVGDMCDLFGDWVPDEWIEEIFKACAAAPQHRYLFLTKYPKRYIKLIEAEKLPQEHWYGETITQGIMGVASTVQVFCEC